MQQVDLNMRDVLQILWNGKKVIAFFVALFLLASTLVSFLLLNITYEATGFVRVITVNENNADNVKTKLELSPYVEGIKSEATLARIIQALNVNYTTQQLQNNIKVSNVNDTNIVQTSVRGVAPVDIKNIANYVSMELANMIELTDRSNTIANSQIRLNSLEEAITVVEQQIAKENELLQQIPEKLITKKSLAEDAFLQSIVTEANKGSVKENGAIQFMSEDINEVHTTVKSKYAEDTINLSKLQQERALLTKKIKENQAEVNEIYAGARTSISFDNPINTIVSETQNITIRTANEPYLPIGPNRTINIILSSVFGLILGLCVVLFRYYWINGLTKELKS